MNSDLREFAAQYSQTVPNRKPRLTEEQIGTAILWLESNEGDEAELLQGVADWLKVELNQRVVKAISAAEGVKPKIVRAAFKKLAEEMSE